MHATGVQIGPWYTWDHGTPQRFLTDLICSVQSKRCLACAQEVVTWKGQLFFEDKPEPEPPALPGSLVAFSLNGALQGVAYRRAPH